MGRSVWLLIAIVAVALLLGPLPAFAFAALIGLIEAIQWIKGYNKNQKDYENDLERQLKILKYKNKQKEQTKSGKP